MEEAEKVMHHERKLPFYRRSLDQCMYSCPAKKMTTFTLNCVNSEKLVRRCTHKGKHAVQAIGIDPNDTKVFVTAQLKELSLIHI